MKFLLCLIFTFCVTPLRADITDAEALLFLKKNAPEIHLKIAPLEKSDPQDFRSSLDEAKTAATDHAKLIAAGDTAAASAYLKMYAIDFTAISIADEIVQATDEAAKQRLTEKLKERIAASLEQWAIVEQARIRRMEAELAKLKADLQQALTDKAKVIDKDTAALIEECRAYQKQKALRRK
jgi:hypothetical protein